jgi:LysM repeat protein
VQTLLRPLLSYLDWANRLKPVWLAGAALLGPPVILAGVLWLLLAGGGGNNNDPSVDNDLACASFSNQAVRDYCFGVTNGDVVDCTDFISSTEASRFVRDHDTANENQLEQTAGAYCLTLAGASGSQPPTGATGATGATGGLPPAPTPTVPAPTATPAPTTYIVESGDNPTLIAEKLGVPADEIDAWVEELLALNGVEANALQVGQELLLPPFGSGAQASTGGTSPANTGDPGGSTGSTGGSTANPTATNTTVVTAAATPTPPPANTPVATTTGATATATATATNTAVATNTPAPTNTPSPTTTQGGPTSFNILESSVNAGETVHYEGAGFTPNDTLTIELYYGNIFLGSETDTTGSTGAFSGSGAIPEEAADYPGTYTIKLTDSHGKTASDSVTVQ